MESRTLDVARETAPLLGLNAFANYMSVGQGVLTPFLAAAWQLSDSQITFLAGVISTGALGTAFLTRYADRHGRRRVLLFAFVAGLGVAFASGFAPGITSYAILQILVLAIAGTLQTGSTVAIAEVVAEDHRPVAQSWYGLVGALGGGLPYMIAPLLAAAAGGWRWMWFSAVLLLPAIPAVRRSLAETDRFVAADRRGAAERSRLRDLFGSRYGRRAAGMLLAGTLRPIALIATGTWTYYHAVDTLGLSAAAASAIVIGGGGLGLIGNPIGAYCADFFGRRPTLIVGACVTVSAGIAYYFVPVDFPGGLPLGLGLAFLVNQIGMNAFGIADRCVDTELFPTVLRASYGGMARLGVAIAAVTCQFSLSLLTSWLGSLPEAIAVLAIAAFLPSIPIFLWAAPETRGLSLDEAALEEAAAIDGEPALET